MSSLTKEGKVGVKDLRCEKSDEFFEETTTIDTIFNLMVFVNKGNLPLLARVYLSVAYLFDGIFKKVVTSDFNLLHFSLIAIVILSLNSHTTFSE